MHNSPLFNTSRLFLASHWLQELLGITQLDSPPVLFVPCDLCINLLIFPLAFFAFPSISLTLLELRLLFECFLEVPSTHTKDAYCLLLRHELSIDSQFIVGHLLPLRVFNSPLTSNGNLSLLHPIL